MLGLTGALTRAAGSAPARAAGRTAPPPRPRPATGSPSAAASHDRVCGAPRAAPPPSRRRRSRPPLLVEDPPDGHARDLAAPDQEVGDDLPGPEPPGVARADAGDGLAPHARHAG